MHHSQLPSDFRYEPEDSASESDSSRNDDDTGLVDDDLQLAVSTAAGVRGPSTALSVVAAGKRKRDPPAATLSPYTEEDETLAEHELPGGLRVPGRLWAKLLEHQQTSLEWLWELHQQCAGGILGDEMGLGKTLQVISIWAALNHTVQSGPCLVVCPATVLMQWVREVKRWAPEIAPVKLLHHSHGGADPVDRIATVRGVVRAHGGCGLCSVLVTSYEMVRMQPDLLLGAAWQYVVLDEGHKIRNPDAEITQLCKRFATRHRLLLTGAPIQNKLTELWSLFDFVMPGKLGAMPTFEEQFALPIAQGTYANASEFSVQAACSCSMILRDVIRPYLLRRLKSDVRIKLPDKTETVLFCYLTEGQRQAYEDILSSELATSVLANRTAAFPLLTSLQKVCNHPHLVTWTANAASPPQDEAWGDWRLSGKLRVLKAVLRVWHAEGHRVAIFCQTRQMLDIVECFVRSRYNYQRLDGTTPVARRLGLIDRFNADADIFAFILTTRAGGLGINLTGANRVVIVDPDWNPANDLQARERAWRVGQTRDVAVYRLITGGTIEEKVFQRQVFKQALSNRVLTEKTSSNRILKRSDLRELLAYPAPPEEAAGRAGGGDDSWTEKSYDAVTRDIVSRAEAAAEEAAAAKAVAKAAAATEERAVAGGRAASTSSRAGEAGGGAATSDDKADKRQTGMLEKLLRGELVASAIDHDVASGGGGSDLGPTVAGIEARRVAERAAAALRKSREEYEKSAVGTPTWTGRSGVRFGATLSNRLHVAPGRKDAEPSVAVSAFAQGGRGGFVGSSALLQHIRDREKKKDEAVSAAMATPESEVARRLLDEICAFLRQHGRSASSAELVTRFKKCAEPALFKQLLKQVAKMEGGVWVLDEELV